MILDSPAQVADELAARTERVVEPAAEFVDFGPRNHEIAAISQDNWPHAFARFDCSVDTFIASFHCNHIHGVYGDWVTELQLLCGVLDVECRVLRG